MAKVNDLNPKIRKVTPAADHPQKQLTMSEEAQKVESTETDRGTGQDRQKSGDTLPPGSAPPNSPARWDGLLEECKLTGKSQPLFEATELLGSLSPGEFSDFQGACRKAMRESTAGLHIDMVALKKEWRRARANSAVYNRPKETTAKKPSIVVSNRQLDVLRNEAMAALLLWNSPPKLFRRLRNLVTYRIDAASQPFLETINWISLRGLLADAAKFYTMAELTMVGTFPPRALCEDLVAYDHVDGSFPAVEAITKVPVIRPDGTIFDSRGFDATTRMIYCPPRGFALPPLPDKPTKEQVESAVRQLRELVADFPFEEPSDQVNFIAFCLTLLIRHLIDVAPLGLFDSPVSGAGKGLLTDIAAIIATGDVAAVIAAPNVREEWPKLIFSLLDAGRTFVVFDNLNGILQSDALEAVLTKPLFQSRVLGASQERIVPNRAVWSATGNNIAVSRDMVRRCFRIRIDPRCSQPHLRTKFKHDNLVDYCKTRRADILASLLMLIRSWHAAGRPGFGGTALGTYTLWRNTIGGILKNAGLDGFLANQRKLYSEMDIESEEWERFLTALDDNIPELEFGVSRIVSLIHGGCLSDMPREIAKIYGQSLTHKESKPNPYFAVQLGHILRARHGTRFGASEIYLERSSEDRHAKVVLYRVKRGST